MMYKKYNQSQVTRSPRDTLKLMILQRWNYCTDTLEIYYKQKAQGQRPFLAPVKAGVIALFNQIRPALQGDKKVNYKLIVDKVYASEFMNIEEAYNEIADWLYSKGLLKFDEISLYDSTDANEEDEAQGL